MLELDKFSWKDEIKTSKNGKEIKFKFYAWNRKRWIKQRNKKEIEALENRTCA